MDQLPLDIILHICSFFDDTQTYFSLAKTNRKFRDFLINVETIEKFNNIFNHVRKIFSIIKQENVCRRITHVVKNRTHIRECTDFKVSINYFLDKGKKVFCDYIHGNKSKAGFEIKLFYTNEIFKFKNNVKHVRSSGSGYHYAYIKYDNGLISNKNGKAMNTTYPYTNGYVFPKIIRSQLSYLLGITVYMIDGVLHNETGPAFSSENGYFWYYNSKLHNLNGPAVEITYISNKGRGIRVYKHVWYKNGLIHNENGPAVLYYKNDPSMKTKELLFKEVWYYNNKIHNEAGPAIKDYDKNEEFWYFNGKLHNTKGPAYINTKTDVKKWYFDGKLHNTNGHPAYISPVKLIWYKHGVCHNDSNNPTCYLSYDKTINKLGGNYIVKKSSILWVFLTIMYYYEPVFDKISTFIKSLFQKN